MRLTHSMATLLLPETSDWRSSVIAPGQEDSGDDRAQDDGLVVPSSPGQVTPCSVQVPDVHVEPQAGAKGLPDIQVPTCSPSIGRHEQVAQGEGDQEDTRSSSPPNTRSGCTPFEVKMLTGTQVLRDCSQRGKCDVAHRHTQRVSSKSVVIPQRRLILAQSENPTIRV